MSETEHALFDFVAATRDALTLPLPHISDSDRELCRVTTDARTDAVRIASEMIVRDGSTSAIRAAAEWLRSRIGQLPVTYRPYERPDAQDAPRGRVARGLGIDLHVPASPGGES